jgi:hypothetical protein
VDGCTAMSCFGVASALDGGRQSVVTYGSNLLVRFKNSSAEVDCQVVFGRFVMLGLSYVVIRFKSRF